MISRTKKRAVWFVCQRNPVNHSQRNPVNHCQANPVNHSQTNPVNHKYRSRNGSDPRQERVLCPVAGVSE